MNRHRLLASQDFEDGHSLSEAVMPFILGQGGPQVEGD